MRNAYICGFAFVTLLTLAAPSFAVDFSAKVVDRLGRPVPGVQVTIYWLKRISEEKVDQVDLAKLTSAEDGIVKGQYDQKSVPTGETIWSEIKKQGYQSYSTDGLRTNYVIDRQFKTSDVERIANLGGDAQRDELMEILAGEVERDGEKSFEEAVFVRDRELRPALRELIRDPRVGGGAMGMLAFIGVPEDLSAIVQAAPKTNREPFANRWAYVVVTALLEPSSDADWSFLEACAANDYDDLWVDAGAIQALKLIGSTKSTEILQRVLKKNHDREPSIQLALNYIKSNPPPLADKDLTVAAKKVADVLQIGKLREIKKPRFNESGDKALVDFEFVAGRDLLVHTATFHKVSDVWKLRGVRETLQALMANPSK